MKALFGAALAVLVVLSAGNGRAQTADPIFLKQNFEKFRTEYYKTPQGSLVMLYDYFMSLEMPNAPNVLFATKLERFGYIPNKESPDKLPVGFFDETRKSGLYLGMNCAACHTRQIQYGGKTLQIDGAPANANMHAFMAGIADALEATAADKQALDRFVKRVKQRSTITNHTEAYIREQVRKLAVEWRAVMKSSTPAKAEWGPARLDAFNMIFNRVTSINTGIPENSRTPDAPVSYPFLWDTSWHDRVQWDGLAKNIQIPERSGRNAGQTLGVFGTVDLHSNRSSVRIRKQIAMDNWLQKLQSPEWPSQFPPIDKDKAKKGEAIYAQTCASCHQVIAPKDRMKFTNVHMVSVQSIGTDPVMANVAAERTAVIDGQKMKAVEYLASTVVRVLSAEQELFIGYYLSQGEIKARRWAADNPNPTVGKCGATPSPVLMSASSMAVSARNVLGEYQKQYVERANKREDEACRQYKARPLNGIWATAPYLHNGSVPNLYELLLPSKPSNTQPRARVSEFWVGSSQFDPVNVGFEYGKSPEHWRFDTSITGNRNTGHEGAAYGTTLSDEDRYALIEYIKTL